MFDTPKIAMQIPDDFPWQRTIGLLLDAVQVKRLLPRLYEWDPELTVEPLYLTTRFAELRDLSPCLVRLKGPGDNIFQQFLTHASESWGYVLISDEPWPTMVAHLRWLVSVAHPSGEEMLLRIADPAVAHALLGDQQTSTTPLFGPCQQVMLADAVSGDWVQYLRAGEAPLAKHAALYRLSDRQWEQLNEAAFRKMITELYWHMAEFFPDFRTDLTAQKRWQHLHELAKEAVGIGLESEADIWLYANAHGFLAGKIIDDSRISEVLDPNSGLPPAKRRSMILDLTNGRPDRD